MLSIAHLVDSCVGKLKPCTLPAMIFVRCAQFQLQTFYRASDLRRQTTRRPDLHGDVIVFSGADFSRRAVDLMQNLASVLNSVLKVFRVSTLFSLLEQKLHCWSREASSLPGPFCFWVAANRFLIQVGSILQRPKVNSLCSLAQMLTSFCSLCLVH